MEKNKKNKVEVIPEHAAFSPLDFFVVRTPLLPVQAYYTITEQLNSHPSVAELVHSNPKIETALAVGNPSFYQAIHKAIEHEAGASAGQGPKAKDTEKIIGKLLRVLTRLSTRPTPFGLYAGVAMGQWNESSTLQIECTGAQSRTRLDMQLLARVALSLEKQLLPELRLVCNPTLCQFSGKLYLLEKSPVLDEHDVDGSWLECTPEVEEILALTKRPIAYKDLLLSIADKCDMYEEDAQALIEYMVEQTYLFTNMRPNTFDVDAAERLLATIDNTTGTELDALREVIASLRSINNGEQITSARYLQISERARQACDGEVTSALQTDMALSLKNITLKKDVAQEMAVYLEMLMRMGPMHPQSSPLRPYKDAFMAKYEQREVPLLEVLNQDYGLGFPEYSSEWSFNMDEYSRQIVLDEIIGEAIRDHKIEVELTSEMLSKLLAKPAKFQYPISTDLFVTVLADSLEHIDQGKFLLANGAVLAGAGRNLGRFADLLGEQGVSALKIVVEAERALAPKEILAELSSLPRTFRLGNVCTVPIVRPYRIVLDSWPGEESEHSGSENIDLDDLLLGLENSSFYLRSIKHRARVRINSPSLMNPLYKTQIARFLTAITEDAQGFAGKLRWGTANDANFKPRVKYGKFILSPAQWTIRVDAAKKDHFAKFETFKKWLQDWRNRWFVPRYVQLREFDNLLLLDLESDAQIEELRRELTSQKNTLINLQETYCSPEQLWANGPDGKYVTELVGSFVLKDPSMYNDGHADQYSAHRTADPNAIPRATRVRCPGNEWIYVKIYCGKSLQDDLLVASIGEFIEGLKGEELISSWFFIKYADTDPHLRLRMTGDPVVLQEQVYNRLLHFCNGLVSDGPCTRFQIDTYAREVERYGGLHAIGLAEEMFCADSDLAVQLLRLEASGELALERQVIATLVIDMMLESLGIQGQAKSSWYKKYSISRNEVGDDFRECKDKLHFVFSHGYHDAPLTDLQPAEVELFEQIGKWNLRVKEIGSKYAELESQSKLVDSIAEIASSFVHMHCNRYLGIDHKAESKARALACRSHEARCNRNLNSQRQEKSHTEHQCDVHTHQDLPDRHNDERDDLVEAPAQLR